MDVAAGEKKDLDLLGAWCVDLTFSFLFNMLDSGVDNADFFLYSS